MLAASLKSAAYQVYQQWMSWKWRYRFLKQSCDLMLVKFGRVMFGSLFHYVSTLLSAVSIHLLQVKICMLFLTWPHKTTLLRCHACMGEISSQHVTTLKSLVIIAILIVKMKNALTKTQILNLYFHWKIELIGWPLYKKKMAQPQKCTFWKEVPKNKKIK